MFGFGTGHIRYNVTAVSGVTSTGLTMTASFRDHGPNERLVLRLKQYALLTGVTTVLMTLDSNDFAPSDDFQVGSAHSVPAGLRLDFVNNSYFVDAEFTKIRPRWFYGDMDSASVALAMIQLTNPCSGS
jgi:hypothetical protein